MHPPPSEPRPKRHASVTHRRKKRQKPLRARSEGGCSFTSTGSEMLKLEVRDRIRYRENGEYKLGWVGKVEDIYVWVHYFSTKGEEQRDTDKFEQRLLLEPQMFTQKKLQDMHVFRIGRLTKHEWKKLNRGIRSSRSKSKSNGDRSSNASKRSKRSHRSKRSEQSKSSRHSRSRSGRSHRSRRPRRLKDTPVSHDSNHDLINDVSEEKSDQYQRLEDSARRAGVTKISPHLLRRRLGDLRPSGQRDNADPTKCTRLADRIHRQIERMKAEE